MDITPIDLGGSTFLVDTAMADYPGIVAAYLIAGERPCLVETGSATSAARVQEVLANLGLGPADLATIVVTHIHLDHAGGVGDIAAAFPTAEVVVHARGARHLADPERLLASARRVYGAEFDRLFGDLAPTDASRIRVVDDIGEVDLGGGRVLSTYYTPGHAQHHVGLLDSMTGDVYVGDAAGVYVPQHDLLRPSTPPPDFDLDLALTSLRRLAALEPTRLLFSHFGPVGAPGETLERAADEIRLWVELVREARMTDPGVDHAVALVRERTRERYLTMYAQPAEAGAFETLSSTQANVTGIARWLDTAGG